MTPRIMTLLAIATLVWAGSPANSAELTKSAYLTTVSAPYSSAFAALEEAVVNQGLVVDYTGGVGEMLARTGPDVGADSPYAHAGYLQFCSARWTHAAVGADPKNIALCPYVVFGYELKASPGKTVLGYRRPVGADGKASQAAISEIEKLLQTVVDTAAQDVQ